jgi:hypothetical protein
MQLHVTPRVWSRSHLRTCSHPSAREWRRRRPTASPGVACGQGSAGRQPIPAGRNGCPFLQGGMPILPALTCPQATPGLAGGRRRRHSRQHARAHTHIQTHSHTHMYTRVQYGEPLLKTLRKRQLRVMQSKSSLMSSRHSMCVASLTLQGRWEDRRPRRKLVPHSGILAQALTTHGSWVQKWKRIRGTE